MTKRQLKQKLTKVMRNRLLAERNNNVKLAQLYYEGFLSICTENNLNFDNAFYGCLRTIINEENVSDIMNGVITEARTLLDCQSNKIAIFKEVGF